MARNKILVVDDEEGIRDVIAMIIESYYENEIITAPSGNEAIKVIKKEADNLAIIFCDYRMNDGTGADVYHFIKSENIAIPFVLCSTYDPGEIGLETLKSDNPKNASISKPFTSDDILENLTKVFEDNLGDSVEGLDDYLKVEVNRFLELNKDRNINVFIRISDEKFVKIVDGNNNFDGEILKKYQAKGAEYIYLEKEKYLIFLDQSLMNIFSLLDDDDVEEKDKTEAILSSIEGIQNCVRDLGVNERTLELVSKTVEATEKLIKQTKSLNSLLDMLNKQRMGYIKDHAYLTSYIACSIAEKVDWKTEGIWKKLITASFFQNIALEENHLAQIFDLDGPEYQKLGHAEQVMVRDHVFKSVEMLGDDSSFDEDIRKLILNHHEQPNGSGYPRGLGKNTVSPLEALFILAVNFAHVLYLQDESSEDLPVIVQDFNEHYNEGNYKKPYQGFLQAFINVTTVKAE